MDGQKTPLPLEVFKVGPFIFLPSLLPWLPLIHFWRTSFVYLVSQNYFILKKQFPAEPEAESSSYSHYLFSITNSLLSLPLYLLLGLSKSESLGSGPEGSATFRCLCLHTCISFSRVLLFI